MLEELEICHSLAGRVLQSKYFSNPSFFWKQTWRYCDFSYGAASVGAGPWSFTKGNKVDGWGWFGDDSFWRSVDPTLDFFQTCFSTTSFRSLHCELICPMGKCWNHEKLRELFHLLDRDAISAYVIPLVITHKDDSTVWDYDNKGTLLWSSWSRWSFWCE